jgi:hypothetical protein
MKSVFAFSRSLEVSSRVSRGGGDGVDTLGNKGSGSSRVSGGGGDGIDTLGNKGSGSR